MSRTPLHQRLIEIVEPVCTASGYDLVELRFVLEQGGWVLRVCVDLPLDPAVPNDEVPADRVDLSACEDLSHDISTALDVDDPIPQAYSLEVGSPGIDRPLRVASHYVYFTGADAKIQLAAPIATDAGERRNFRGILGGVTGEASDHVVIDCDGKRFELPIADIEHAKLVPDWDAVMKGKRGVAQHTQTANGAGAKPIKPGHRPSKKKSKQPPSHESETKD